MSGLERRLNRTQVKQVGLLATAQDWQLRVNLGRQPKFPETIAETTPRPDPVLISETTKQVVLLELTVRGEERMKETFQKMIVKYDSLARECRSRVYPHPGQLQASLLTGHSSTWE